LLQHYGTKIINFIKHLASQKHRENTERVLGNPPSTRTAQTVATHRVLKRENKETESENSLIDALMNIVRESYRLVKK